MRTTSHRILFIFILPFLFSFTPVKERPVKVALTKASPNYIQWIAKGDPSVIVIDLNNLKPAEAIQKLHECSALLLTGGGDIDPALYGNAGKRPECMDVDLNRDKLETAMINEALSLKMPILGICRGEQMLNVVLGGTLIIDIPSFKLSKNQVKNTSATVVNTGMETAISTNLGNGNKDTTAIIHQCEDYDHCFHPVRLDPDSFLHSIVGSDTGTVTSNHHQAVLELGKGLKKSAQSPDNIIEGIEWKDQAGKSFLVGVQWHPERMDFSNAFSGKILQRFLAEAKKFAVKLQNVK
jgi:putative glutamine amidotransferase